VLLLNCLLAIANYYKTAITITSASRRASTSASRRASTSASTSGDRQKSLVCFESL
jgi:hypothetical protein